MSDQLLQPVVNQTFTSGGVDLHAHLLTSWELDLMGGQHNNGYPASHSHCLPDHLIIEGEADIQLTEVSPGTLHMPGLPQLHSDRSCM